MVMVYRVLDARQLAIKLLANVTYGYTAAGFSGRMPMAELADAVVQCGRSTLEWAMKLVQDGLKPTGKYSGWSNARVVYGMCISWLFVLCLYLYGFYIYIYCLYRRYR